MNITYFKCVYVAFVIQYTMRMLHFVVCRLCGCNVFFHTISKLHDFRKKKKIIERKMCFDFLYKFLRNVSDFEKNLARYDHKCISVYM